MCSPTTKCTLSSSINIEKLWIKGLSKQSATMTFTLAYLHKYGPICEPLQLLSHFSMTVYLICNLILNLTLIFTLLFRLLLTPTMTFISILTLFKIQIDELSLSFALLSITKFINKPAIHPPCHPPTALPTTSLSCSETQLRHKERLKSQSRPRS